MVKNYLKVALRNIGRHKLFTFINIIGLSIGISAAIVIYVIVQHDLSFDKFHPNGNRIYRVVSDFTYSGESGSNSGVTSPLPDAVRAELTGIEKAAPFYTFWGFDVTVPSTSVKPFKQQGGIIVTDARYFDLFKYKWLAGSARNVLDQPNQLVLTDERAKLYFPNLRPDQVIGKIIAYDDSVKVAVTGIVAAYKGNTDLKFHDFISYKTIYNRVNLNQTLQLQNWGGTNSSSQFFIQLPVGGSVSKMETKLNQLYRKHNPPTPKDKGSTHSFKLQPLNDLHFNRAYGIYDDGTLANKTTLYGLLIIAVFLLLLGCINFINLITAQASQRAKEIGIRKTIGSTRLQLVVQLLSETFMITLLAVVASMVCAPFILKLFADFISPDIKLNFLNQPGLLLFLALLTLIVSLFSGFYPAMVLSGYKPVDVLKGQSAVNTGQSRNAWMRKSLTVTQFVIAQFFIMATLLVSKQIYYATHKSLGFNKDAIVYINTPWKHNNNNKIGVFANQLKAMPGVAMVSKGSNPPSSNNTNSTEITYKDGKKELKSELFQKYGDENFIKLYGIKLLAGRNIRQADSTSGFLVNETYTRSIGFKNANDVIGKTLDKYNGDKRMTIVGVVADFQQESIHTPIKSLAILYCPNKYNNDIIHIKLQPETAGGEEWKATLASIQNAWKSIYPEDDFKYTFYDESIRKFYESEQHTSQLLTWASGLSILISCLGLLGLAIYTTRTRTKEIGVRKVLGASVSQIVTLLSTELVALVFLSFVIVTPAAFWAMHIWMQNFADRTAISWWLFALSGIGMLLTALLTLSTQTIKAALSNPVKSLRSE